MKIGVIGTGNMGAALGKAWAKSGHEVMFSYSRNKEKLKVLGVFNNDTSYGSFQEAAAFGDVILIAVQPFLLEEILIDPSIFEGKTIVSCVSGLRPDFSGKTLGLHTDNTVSIAEQIAQILPKSFVIEAFNTTFSGIIDEPFFDKNQPASIFYCGDQQEAKTVVNKLIIDAGFEPIDAGNLATSNSLETFATAWVQLAVVGGFFPNIALKILK